MRLIKVHPVIVKTETCYPIAENIYRMVMDDSLVIIDTTRNEAFQVFVSQKLLPKRINNYATA